MRGEEPTPRWFVAAACLYGFMVLVGFGLLAWAIVEAVSWLHRH